MPDELKQADGRPVCLVTGGTSGVGLSTARLFASRGFNIYTCGRSPERLIEARRLILEAGNGLAICQADQHDLTTPSAADQVADAVLMAFGRIDVLVNNAAMAPLAPIDEMPDAEIEATINLNIRTVYRLTRAVWRQMKAQSSGVIVNISSLAAVDPFPGFSLYGATKAWIDTFTRALANEGAEFGIRSYSIRPGAVETPMLRGLFPDFPAEQTVSPADVADRIWECWANPAEHQSGAAYTVTNQPSNS